jgi:putative tryptophan/tyrosine transport system substrate-binding protein
VRLNVDLILTGGTARVRAAKQATTTIPIVMTTSGDAVASGLVASLARPGGNVTGSTFFVLELMSKRLELLKEAMPRAARVAVLVNADDPSHVPVLEAMESTAKSLKVAFHSAACRNRRWPYQAAVMNTLEAVSRAMVLIALIVARA